MNNFRRLLQLSILLIATTLTTFAQDRNYTVTGRIIDAENGTPLELANISFENRSFWASTDMKGNFSLKLPKGEYQYEVSYLGYQTKTGVLRVDSRNVSNFIVRMSPSSLGLDEVVVTAQEKAMGSSSVIDQAALQHLQPKSVEDILQLLPGNLTKNPSLNSIGQAYIREISGSNNNAMGTAVIVNGAPVSNDASINRYSTAKSGTSLQSGSGQSTTGAGVDLRSFSPDNIENIEVIRGIPSVEYGNLTSGAVIIKTKQGATPWEAKAKVDPNSKIFYVGKGFRFANGTTFNFSTDYSTSYSDMRELAQGFERITGNLDLSRVFGTEKPFSVNSHFSYYRNLNSVRVDPQQYDQDETIINNQGVRFTLNGDWNLHSKVLTELDYNLTASYSWQDDYIKAFMSLPAGITPIGNALENSIYVSPFLSKNYYGEHWIDGNPLDLFAQIKGTKTMLINDRFISTFKLGAEWKFNANFGEGMTFDPNFPPMVSANDIQTIRPRPYNDIPPMETLSAFLENKTVLPLGSTSLNTQIGVRLTEMFIDRDYLDRNNYFAAEPRVNLEWKILNSNNNSFFDNLSIVGGIGKTVKLPSLVYLYPDKAYFDVPLFSYADTKRTYYYSVVQTWVESNTSNPKIEPAIGNKMEFGLSAEAHKISGSVTFFTERYRNEFTFNSTPFLLPFERFSVPAGARTMEYKNGLLYYGSEGESSADHLAQVAPDSLFQTYSTPNNGQKTSKMGIEYSINFGQINPLRTSIIMDGAWLHVERQGTRNSWSKITGSSTYAYDHFPYIALYPGGSGSIENQTNTNIRFITHIPALKMIFSTTAQIVWGTTSQTIYRDENGNDIVKKAVNPRGSSKEATYYREPVAYMDLKGEIHDWTVKPIEAYSSDEFQMIDWYSYTNYFDKEKYPGYTIFNFRLTKEFGNWMELSFLANNLFNNYKIYKQKIGGAYTVLTIPQYFGAELKLKF